MASWILPKFDFPDESEELEQIIEEEKTKMNTKVKEEAWGYALEEDEPKVMKVHQMFFQCTPEAHPAVPTPDVPPMAATLESQAFDDCPDEEHDIGKDPKIDNNYQEENKPVIVYYDLFGNAFDMNENNPYHFWDAQGYYNYTSLGCYVDQWSPEYDSDNLECLGWSGKRNWASMIAYSSKGIQCSHTKWDLVVWAVNGSVADDFLRHHEKKSFESTSNRPMPDLLKQPEGYEHSLMRRYSCLNRAVGHLRHVIPKGTSQMPGNSIGFKMNLVLPCVGDSGVGKRFCYAGGHGKGFYMPIEKDMEWVASTTRNMNGSLVNHDIYVPMGVRFSFADKLFPLIGTCPNSRVPIRHPQMRVHIPTPSKLSVTLTVDDFEPELSEKPGKEVIEKASFDLVVHSAMTSSTTTSTMLEGESAAPIPPDADHETVTYLSPLLAPPIAVTQSDGVPQSCEQKIDDTGEAAYTKDFSYLEDGSNAVDIHYQEDPIVDNDHARRVLLLNAFDTEDFSSPHVNEATTTVQRSNDADLDGNDCNTLITVIPAITELDKHCKKGLEIRLSCSSRQDLPKPRPDQLDLSTCIDEVDTGLSKTLSQPGSHQPEESASAEVMTDEPSRKKAENHILGIPVLSLAKCYTSSSKENFFEPLGNVYYPLQGLKVEDFPAHDREAHLAVKATRPFHALLRKFFNTFVCKDGFHQEEDLHTELAPHYNQEPDLSDHVENVDSLRGFRSKVPTSTPVLSIDTGSTTSEASFDREGRQSCGSKTGFVIKDGNTPEVEEKLTFLIRESDPDSQTLQMSTLTVPRPTISGKNPSFQAFAFSQTSMGSHGTAPWAEPNNTTLELESSSQRTGCDTKCLSELALALIPSTSSASDEQSCSSVKTGLFFDLDIDSYQMVCDQVSSFWSWATKVIALRS
jgi:hypothetical protein